MSTEALASLAGRRVVIVTGKGGTGKTTVAAALAVAAADRGLRVLIAEVGRVEHVPGLIDPTGGPVGYEGRTVMPGLHAMRIDPFEAVAEYIGLQIGSKRVVDAALRNRALRQLLLGAPGWRELITLGKTWHLEQMRDPAGRCLYDLIVVDAPATGHGVTFLDVPRVVYSAVRTGPLARNARRVEDMIRDPNRTLVLPVTLAEELPVQETAELVEQLREDLGLRADRIIVNGVRPSVEDEPAGLLEATRGLPAAFRLRAGQTPADIARCIAYRRGRARLNVTYLHEVQARTGLPTPVLPQLPEGIRGLEDLRRLGALLLPAEAARPERHQSV